MVTSPSKNDWLVTYSGRFHEGSKRLTSIAEHRAPTATAAVFALVGSMAAMSGVAEAAPPFASQLFVSSGGTTGGRDFSCQTVGSVTPVTGTVIAGNVIENNDTGVWTTNNVSGDFTHNVFARDNVAVSSNNAP
jgi:hypothetical protein